MGKKKTKTKSENYQELSDEFYKFKDFVTTRMSEYATRFYVNSYVECQDDQIETIKIHNRYYLAAIAAVLLALLLSNMISCMSGCPSCHRNSEPPAPQNRVSNTQDTVPEYIDGTILNIDEIDTNPCSRITRIDRN